MNRGGKKEDEEIQKMQNRGQTVGGEKVLYSHWSLFPSFEHHIKREGEWETDRAVTFLLVFSLAVTPGVQPPIILDGKGFSSRFSFPHFSSFFFPNQPPR